MSLIVRVLGYSGCCGCSCFHLSLTFCLLVLLVLVLLVVWGVFIEGQNLLLRELNCILRVFCYPIYLSLPHILSLVFIVGC